LFSFALYQLTHSDYLFSLGRTKASAGVRAAPAPAAGAAVTLREAAAGWQQRPQRTLVAVTASGGGIQAAAWTARVLTGLREIYGDEFTRSLRLVSAVSGGSVGAMYAFDAWSNPRRWQRHPAPPERSICDCAMASSLDATAWGLAFPDLLRIVVPPLISQTDDRGARIEQAWRDCMLQPEARMADWGPLIRAGQMPIPIFNATVVESGQRFVASPVVAAQLPGIPPGVRARQLFELYRDSNPLVSTMVRLSATFPFISPICRPEHGPDDTWSEDSAYHYADGGYVDNEGMVTVIEWLMEVLASRYAPGAFERILLVRLMPFPVAGVPGAALDKGWFYATVGPIDAIQNVRTSSQQERNELAVRLFSEWAARNHNIEVRSAVFRYDVPGADEPPLSWMLTERQKAAVDAAWEEIVRARATPDGPLAAMDPWFR
jgi:hypothetical protein